ncbi:MAG: repeat containing protein [Verrucomicrobiales bacterium]|nr:repeat containing protein [Verrucomicrobiales bacterium]
MNWALIFNSLCVSATATAASVVLGFFAALWLMGLEPRWRKWVLALAAIALVIPPFLVTNTWLHYLGETGVWRPWLPLSIFSLGGTIWILVLLHWPITLFFVASSWQRLEPAQLECDPLLSGGPLVRWLLVPMARNALIQAAMITFVLTLNNFAVPAILQTRVFLEEVWVSFTTKFNYAEALKLSWPLIVVPLVFLFWFRAQKVSWPHKQNVIRAKLFRQQLGEKLFWSAGVLTLLVVLFSDALPLGQIIFSGKTWSNFLPALAAGQRALIHSVLFAGISASVIIGIGIVTARLPLGGILWVSFLIPGVLLGIAFIWIFNRSPFTALYQSLGIVIVAYVVRYLAIGWTGVAHALNGVDRNLTDAARMEGANDWQVFRHVQWPQVFPQIAAVWYVVYLLCIWDVESIVLIVPPDGETLALRAFNLLHYGYNSQINALCLLLLLIAVAPFVFWTAGRALIQTSRRGVSVCLFFVSCALCFSGCSDSGGLKSKIFSDVKVIGSRGTALGQFNKPRALALDRDDNLYVVDMTGRVQKFSPDGKFLMFWQMPQTVRGNPKGMSRDGNGNIIVVEPHYWRVNHFTTEGKLVTQWGEHGTNAGQLAFPRGVAVNSHGEVFVSEYEMAERVQRFAPDGKKFLSSFGSAGDGAGEFNRAESLGIDSHDRIYVADSCNHRIQVFSPEGKFLRSYGKAGNKPGELSYPYDVRVDASGLQFVCEFGNSRVQIFDANDQPIEILGGPGGAPAQFSNPWSLALDSKGNLYVADSMNHRVQKFVRKKA